MSHVTALAIALALIGPASAATEAQVPTEPAARIQYDRIETLSTSPSVWVRDNSPDQGRYLRFVAYARVEENAQEMRVESWTYGDEGCCARLVRSRQFTLEAPLAQSFKTTASPNCNHYFKFLGWVSLTSFNFSQSCKRYVALDAHKDVIRIREAR